MATSDRRPWVIATVLDQDLLDEMQDNLETALHMVCVLQSPTGFIYVSDRNKYVGSVFYEALTQFPTIRRTVGDWLSPTTEFSRLELSLGNVDGRFNNFLPSGADFAGWIGKTVQVLIGLGEMASTYKNIYEGIVTDIGGLKRDRQKIVVVSRDVLDQSNIDFPNQSLNLTTWPDLDEALIGTLLPVIYGDWTTALVMGNDPPTEIASIPAFPVNGRNAGVLAGTTSVRLLISQNDNLSLDTNNIWLKRGDRYYGFDAGDVVSVVGNRDFQLKQGGNGGTTLVDSAPYQYAVGDQFVVRLQGKSLGAYQDNLVWQARDILVSIGGVDTADLDANWATYRDKASPAESAVSTFKSRVWTQDVNKVVDYVKSMLQQARLELFVSRDLKLKLLSTHLDEFDATPSYSIKNWDLQADSMTPMLQDQNVFNRANGFYGYDPTARENTRYTPVFRNQAAINQAGKTIQKTLVFPNLYREADVVPNIKEVLKLASAYTEIVEATLTPRSMLRDIGDFVSLDVDLASLKFSGAPAMIREIGYDPVGLRIPVKLWSFQMVPFPGYAPGYDGIVGGSTATITQE